MSRGGAGTGNIFLGAMGGMMCTRGGSVCTLGGTLGGGTYTLGGAVVSIRGRVAGLKEEISGDEVVVGTEALLGQPLGAPSEGGSWLSGQVVME